MVIVYIDTYRLTPQILQPYLESIFPGHVIDIQVSPTIPRAGEAGSAQPQHREVQARKPDNLTLLQVGMGDKYVVSLPNDLTEASYPH